MKVFAAISGTILFGGHAARAFYLPGVAPRSFLEGETVELKVNALTSIEDPYPLEYYRLPFCKPPEGIVVANENLGEFLAGDRIDNSPYRIEMKIDMYCEQVCVTNLGRGESNPGVTNKKEKRRRVSKNKVVRSIRRDYHNNWMVDNLPAASKMDYFNVQGEHTEEDTEIKYWQGFPVGFVDPENESSYIYNHVNIELQYHEVETEDNMYRIVGFTIEPFSIKHEFDKIADMEDEESQSLETAEITNPMPSCKKGKTAVHTDFNMASRRASQEATGQVLFTYDVLWAENKELQWASRWDIYLKMNDAYPVKIHWLSIANSMVIVCVLSAMIAAILVRNLRRDFSRYSAVPTDDERAEELEEYGWKLVHADVFRPPSYPMLIAVFCGSGMQILLMCTFTLIFACMGFLSPSNRGYLLITLLLLYVLFGFIAGYTTSRLYKTFRGKSWQKATILTAFGFPGITFLVFFVLNLFTIAQKSGDAVPFHTMFTVLVLWFGISSPLVFFGAFIGYKKDVIEFPVNTSNIPRQIPDQPWFMGLVPTLFVGGIMPFGSCFLELYFIMSSIWLHQYYYVFGILFIVFIILLVTCAEIAILYNYFKLCGEDYQWWWMSYYTGGSTALYVFGYSIIYFQQMQANTFSSYVLYFGYMGLFSLMVFLMTGTVGLFSALYFNKAIFASIKID